MQKGTTSKGMEANKNFAKWLSCGIQISGTFGLHHVYEGFDTSHCTTLSTLIVGQMGQNIFEKY
jgi:hypothetical protein